jgi:hypothetical protein
MFTRLDVHKESLVVAVAEGGLRGAVREYGRIANTTAALDRWMGKLGGAGVRLRLCYEAGPCGYGDRARGRGDIQKQRHGRSQATARQNRACQTRRAEERRLGNGRRVSHRLSGGSGHIGRPPQGMGHQRVKGPRVSASQTTIFGDIICGARISCGEAGSMRASILSCCSACRGDFRLSRLLPGSADLIPD